MGPLANADLAAFVVLACIAFGAIASQDPRHANLPVPLRPHRPMAIRLINGAGSLLDALGLVEAGWIDAVSLDTDSLIAAGCAEAADRGARPPCTLLAPELERFGGGPGWRHGLENLTSSLEAEARLTFLGRVIARGQVVAALRQRATLQAHWRDDAAGAESSGVAPIINPIVIVGLPRTGTTFIQELLSQDPGLRAPKTWELMEPLPPATGEVDDPARIATVQWQIDQYKQLSPGLDAYHPLSATRPEEDILIMSQNFDSQQFEACYSVPSYVRWLLELDSHGATLEWHKRVLQTLQGSSRRQWVLKTPYYLALLHDVRRAYPDARVIQMHRDPAEVLASSSSVHAKTFGIVSDHVDLEEIGAEQVFIYRELLSRMSAVRAEWAAVDQPDADFRIADVHLADLQADPIATIRTVYTTLLGRELSPDAEIAMRGWLANNKRNKHGRHKFSERDFGIDVENDSVFAAYRAVFQAKGAQRQ